MSKNGNRHTIHNTTSIKSWQELKISTIIDKPPVEKQKRMLCFPMEFGYLANIGLIDASALTDAISEVD